MVFVGALTWTTVANYADFFGLGMVGLAISGICGIVVFFHRYERLPSTERETEPVHVQLILFTKR
jgi:hypothetical protein